MKVSTYLLKTYYLLIFYTEHHPGHMPAFSIKIEDSGSRDWNILICELRPEDWRMNSMNKLDSI